MAVPPETARKIRPTSDLQFEKRFSTNLVTNVIQFLISVVFGLILVPFFLDTLGEAAYGLIPLATSLTTYVVIIIDAFGTAITRFLAIDIQRGDIEKANETYNTALFGTLGIFLLCIPVVILLAWFSPFIFDIGEQAASSVFILFLLVFLSVLIRSWSSNFMTTLFAVNRLDLRNCINIVNTLLQFVCVVLLFVLFSPSLEAVGISYLATAAVTLLLAYLFSRRICPYLRIRFSNISIVRMKEIGKLSLWVVLNSFGAILYTQVALFLTNILCGDIAASQYAIAYTWYTLIYTIGGLVTNQFTPLIYAYYSGNKMQGLVRFTKFSTKCTGLFLALPIGLACIFAPQLLSLWVGSEYASLSLLVCIIVIPVIVHIQSSCSYAVYISTNTVQIPAFANFVTGGFVICLALLLTLAGDMGMYGIAISVGTGMILRQGVFNPIYTAYVLKAPLSTYFSSIWSGVAALAVLLAVGVGITRLVSIDSLWLVILLGIIISAIYLLILVKLVLKKEERAMIKSCLPVFLQRRLPSWIL